MPRRRLLPAVFALLAAFAVVTTAFQAHAQTSIVPTVSGIQRTAPRRTDPLTTLWISRSDCLANDVMTFPLIVSGFVGTLEVWASNGADCRPPEARNSSVSQCWKVFSGAATNSLTLSIPIRVQDIAAMKKPPEFAQSIGDESSCTPAAGSAAAASAAQPITLFFMAILGDQNQGGASWNTKLDLVGPPPPLSPPAGTTPLGVGNTLLVPAWSATGDIDVAGYDFFCVPVDADASAAASTPATSFGPGVADADAEPAAVVCPDASAATDATDEGGVSDAGACTPGSSTPSSTTSDAATRSPVAATCGSFSAFVTGSPPTAADLKFLCGSVAGPLATSFTITGLQNGTKYEVAIGAFDAVGNVGPLGAGNCASPEPTIGFAENYHAAGGTAGGGFCSMGRPARAGAWGWGAASVLAVGMGLARRRRRPASS